MDVYTEEQLIEMYAQRRYKRWVKQKIKMRLAFILIVLSVLVNVILVVVLIFGFNREVVEDCVCPDEYDCLEAEDVVVNVNAIPGRYAFLTFDDGPSVYTGRILDVLNEWHAPGTFFVLGSSINNRSNSRELLNRILNEGHYIGLHTMTHDFDTLYVGEGAPERFVNEMFELNELIYGMTGSATNLCRAAYGMAGGTFTPEHHAAVDQAGLYCIDWNIDSNDWHYHTADMVYYNIISQIERLGYPDELVILFHEFSWSAEALPEVIGYLRYHGYTIVAYTPGRVLTYYRFR